MTLKERIFIYTLLFMSVPVGYRLFQWHIWTADYIAEGASSDAQARVEETQVTLAKKVEIPFQELRDQVADLLPDLQFRRRRRRRKALQ